MRPLIGLTLIGLAAAVLVAGHALRASDSPEREPPIELQIPGDSPHMASTKIGSKTAGADGRRPHSDGSPGPTGDDLSDDRRDDTRAGDGEAAKTGSASAPRTAPVADDATAPAGAGHDSQPSPTDDDGGDEDGD